MQATTPQTEEELAPLIRGTLTREKQPVQPRALDGMAAMGHVIPPHRKANALDHVREMVPGISTADATALIDAVSEHLRKDRPYEAQARAMEVLDLTGAYRLMAALLTG